MYAVGKQHFFCDLQPSCNLESLTEDRCTALHLATIQGYPAVIERLVGYGADVNATLEDGNAPLHILLSKQGNMKELSTDTPEIMKVLFLRGAWPCFHKVVVKTMW